MTGPFKGRVREEGGDRRAGVRGGKNDRKQNGEWSVGCCGARVDLLAGACLCPSHPSLRCSLGGSLAAWSCQVGTEEGLESSRGCSRELLKIPWCFVQILPGQGRGLVQAWSRRGLSGAWRELGEGDSSLGENASHPQRLSHTLPHFYIHSMPRGSERLHYR